MASGEVATIERTDLATGFVVTSSGRISGVTQPGAVSVDPVPSTVLVAVGQLVLNEATGATLGAEAPSGSSTTVHMVALAVATAAVAVTPALAPTGETLLRSVAIDVIRPAPVPRAMLRWVWPAGVVQPVVRDADLSAQ